MTVAGPVVVATVLVYSNQHGLREVLRRLANQSVRPNLVVVVDNGSPDAVSIDPGYVLPVALVRSERNVGVGGGHNLAVRAALDDHGADVVWLLEHDTFPEPDCLESLLTVRATSSGPGVVVAEVSRHHYQRVRMARSVADGEAVDRFTFNGPLIDREVFDSVGLLEERLFVGQEDWEFSARVRAAGLPMQRCGSGVVLHAHRGQRQFGAFTSPMRLYYSARNLQWLNRPSGVVGRFRVRAVALAKASFELVRPGRGPAYARARWWASADVSSDRMGPTARRIR